MRTKLFEIRDSATFIPAIAMQLVPDNQVDSWLLSRAGWGLTISDQAEYILVARLDDMKFHYDPHEWGSNARTMPIAHQFIQQNWLVLQSGEVIDVEYILELTTAAKTSERYDSPY